MPHFRRQLGGVVGSSKPFFYQVTAPSTLLGVSLADTKEFLAVTGTADDALITSFIKSATLCFQESTSVFVLDTTFKTFRDVFPDTFCTPDRSIELRRARLTSITSIQYLKETVLTTVDSTIFYTTKSDGYSVVLPFQDKDWPNDVDQRLQAIEIVFIVGFGPNDTSVPEDIKLALKQHVAKLYENRGDCADCEGAARATVTKRFTPLLTQEVYARYRILEFGVNER